MDGTILGQGTFTVGASVTQQIIQIPSNADWVEVKNYTQAGTAGVAAPNTKGVEFYWQRGMASGTGMVKYYGNGGQVVSGDTLVSGGFTAYDPSLQTQGASVALTALTAAGPAVVTTGSTAGLRAGSVVRFNTLDNSPYIGGIDFTVGRGTLTGTTFSVDYLNLTGGVAPTSGFWKVLNYDPLFYPRRRTITNITAATSAVITLSVDHGFTVGQEVRLQLRGGSAVWGNYSALDNQQVTITAVNVATGFGNNTITVDYDTTGFGTFLTSFLALTNPYTPAEVIPFGEDTATALSSISQQTPQIGGQQIFGTNTGILADATVNTGFMGMILGTGGDGLALTTNITGPAGAAASDKVYWKCGKASFGGL